MGTVLQRREMSRRDGQQRGRLNRRNTRTRLFGKFDMRLLIGILVSPHILVEFDAGEKLGEN
jgi:hypothetical protein